MRSRGFTLLEILVAISIFAIIGLGANRMLQTIIQTHDITRTRNAGLYEVVRTLSLLEGDLRQTVPRGIRDEYGEPRAALMVGSGAYALELTRAGWSNPAERSRSELQRVAWALEDGKLVRYFWLVLDRAQDSEPVRHELLSEVEDFRIEVLDQDGDSSGGWPVPDSPGPLPVAIAVEIDRQRFGILRRVFELPEAAVKVNLNREDGGQTGNLSPGDRQDEPETPGGPRLRTPVNSNE